MSFNLVARTTKGVTEGVSGLVRRYFAKTSFYPDDIQGKLGIFGVPFGKGQKKGGKIELGLKLAPNELRKTGFIKKIQCLGLDVIDMGNIKYDPLDGVQQKNMYNLDHVSPCVKQVYKSVKGVLEDSRRCLVLGGDHSITVGSIYGHIKFAGSKKVAVIYVDAHVGLNTETTSVTGNIQGMTVALLAQELRELWPECGVDGLDWLKPCLCLKNIAYIGTRSVDTIEARILCKNHVAVFSMEDIGKLGIHNTVCQALNVVDPFSNKSIHLSFDIDALDVFEAPCTTTPERGGLLLREAIEIAEMLHSTGRLSVIDFVEVNTEAGDDVQKKITLDAAKHILLAMFGHSRRGNRKNV